jgi:hypothetical protein
MEYIRDIEDDDHESSSRGRPDPNSNNPPFLRKNRKRASSFDDFRTARFKQSNRTSYRGELITGHQPFRVEDRDFDDGASMASSHPNTPRAVSLRNGIEGNVNERSALIERGFFPGRGRSRTASIMSGYASVEDVEEYLKTRKQDGGTILGIHNLAIVAPQFVVCCLLNRIKAFLSSSC